MSRVDHIVARRQESSRKRRRTHLGWTATTHKQGSPWWRKRFAEIVEKRRAVVAPVVTLADPLPGKLGMVAE